MSKTTVHFLRANRRIAKRKITASRGYMDFEDGFYIVSPHAINRKSKDGKLKKGSEMFFFEGNSSPIPIKKSKDSDPSSDYLDNMIYVNFLEQTGDPDLDKFKSGLNLIKPLTSHGSLMKIILAILILGTLARSYLSGLFV